MKNNMTLRSISLVLCLTVAVSTSGCARLQPNEYAQYGYKGESVVQEGRKVLIVDWLGNFFGAFSKLLLWNWKVNRHNITDETEKAVHDYLAAHKDELGDVQVQLNRYAPQDAWKRLIHNKGVKWPYRLFIGTFVVLFADTLFINRIFAGDYYNPYTHQVNIYSDLPSVALHELGHAKDFAARRYRGSYALFRIVPFADLYQEFQATDQAFRYVREEKLEKTEVEAYKVLYPAYGTYAGSYGGFLFIPFGTVIGAIVGHIIGRSEARKFEATHPAAHA